MRRSSMRVIAAPRIGHAVAMGESDRALAQAFEHQHVESPRCGEIDRRLEPVGGKSGAGADAESVCCAASVAPDSAQSPLRFQCRGRTGRPSTPATA